MLKLTIDQLSQDIPSGTQALISGQLLTARDQAHIRLCRAIREKQPLPFDLNGAAIYYCGATPARDGEIIGSCGPTTSARMDSMTPTLLAHGLRVMIGKGRRNEEVMRQIRQAGAFYLLALGGCGALYQSCVTDVATVAYPDLGCEAVLRLTVKDMPIIFS